MPARPEIAAAVIVQGRRVLLVRRRVAEGSLSWQFRALAYVACDVVSGTARVASPREIAEVAWCGPGDLDERVPSGFASEVTVYLGARLTAKRPTETG
jgi:8-oxo-dGTP diphosphatase